MSKGVCNFWDFLPSFEINFSMELGAWKLQRHSSLSRHTTFSLSERKNIQKTKRTRYLYLHVSWRKQSSGCTCIPGRESIHSKSIMETNRQGKKEPIQLIIFFQLPCCCNHSHPKISTTRNQLVFWNNWAGVVDIFSNKKRNSVLHFSLIDSKNKSSNIFTSLDPPTGRIYFWDSWQAARDS